MEWKTGWGREEKWHTSGKTPFVALFLVPELSHGRLRPFPRSGIRPGIHAGLREQAEWYMVNYAVVSAAFTRLLRCPPGAR